MCGDAWFVDVFRAVGGGHMLDNVFAYIHSRILNCIVGVEQVRPYIAS